MAAALAAGGDRRSWRGEKLLCGDRKRDSVLGNPNIVGGCRLVRGFFMENNSGGTKRYHITGSAAAPNKSLDASGGSAKQRQKEKGKRKKKSRRRVNSTGGTGLVIPLTRRIVVLGRVNSAVRHLIILKREVFK
jgi:hypothetical protein